MNDQWGRVPRNRATHMFQVHWESDKHAFEYLRACAREALAANPDVSDEALGDELVFEFLRFLRDRASPEHAVKVQVDVGWWNSIDRIMVAEMVKATLEGCRI